MKTVKILDASAIKAIVRHRHQEKKLGEELVFATAAWAKELERSSARFVILGIAEDIGVRANYGRAGAATAFRPAIESFLNQQANAFFDSASVMVLGELEVSDLMSASRDLDPRNPLQLQQLRALVSEVDGRVSEVIRSIVRTGKVPVVIGGGHNNAYGCIRGAAEALGTPVHAINCDPHLDFRPLEGRHSGNGFSYAFSEGRLARYAVVGMHEQYNSSKTLEQFRNNPGKLYYTSFEQVFVTGSQPFESAVRDCIGFVKAAPCGVEIDLDAITNVPSSARTSSGLSALQARQYVHACGAALKPLYLHIAEGAPTLAHIKADNKTGKLIAYLVTDFIKAVSARLPLSQA